MRTRRNRRPDPEDEPEHLDLGPCCCCEATGPTVRNLVMIERRTRLDGTGWGCVTCDLPNNGALAVICDACAEAAMRSETKQPDLRFVIDDYPARKKRLPYASTDGTTWAHDPAFHPELQTGWTPSMPEEPPPFVIEHMYAYVSIDAMDGSEGIIGFRTREGWMPMVGADLARMESLRDRAELAAQETNQTVRLVRFSVREVLEVFEPNEEE